MQVIQPVFNISDAAAAGMAIGTLYRSGGVIRDTTTGRIVEHLKDIAIKDKVSSTSALSETVDIARNVAKSSTRVVVKKSTALSLGSKFAVGTLIVAGVAAVGYGSYRLVTYLKKHTEDNIQVKVTEGTSDVIEYNPELTEYFNNMQSQGMTLDSIKDVVKFFDNYSKGGIEIEITNEEMMVMRNLIVRYTIKLCEANNISLENKQLDTETSITDSNDLLNEILYATRVQGEIFTIA